MLLWTITQTMHSAVVVHFDNSARFSNALVSDLVAPSQRNLSSKQHDCHTCLSQISPCPWNPHQPLQMLRDSMKGDGSCFDRQYLHANSNPGARRHVAPHRSAPSLIAFGGHQDENASRRPERRSIFLPVVIQAWQERAQGRLRSYCHSAAVSGRRGKEMMQERQG